MRAAQITTYGGAEVLQTVANAPRPQPAAGQVLVEVHAAGVNPFDWKVREGYVKDMAPLAFPATLGGDAAGVVADIGEGVSGFRVGQEVYGQANALSGEGSFAEFTPVVASQLGPKPKSVDFVTAAALPLAGCSAIQALIGHAHLQKGQKILIHGGAGGIGSLAIQLAKSLGATVATTAAPDSSDFVRQLGADTIIDYTSEDFSQELSGYDVVFDTIGGETYAKSFAVLVPGGVIVSMVEQADEPLAQQYNVSAIHQSTKVTQERLAKLAELVDSGTVKVTVDKTFPLEQAGEALAYLQSGKHRGKVVIKVK